MTQIAPATAAANAVALPGLPLVVQLGFAGSRTLVDDTVNPGIDREAFESALELMLRDRLLALRGDLGLGPRHFFCGISQVATGADSVFTRACAELDWPQRIFLPEPRSDFLGATSSVGVPDFTPAQQATALALLASPHIIQERVVSEARDRSDRFTDVNLELVRVSDVIVCLVRATTVTAKAGGTQALIDDAIKRGRCLLEIRVGVKSGEPSLAEEWHYRAGFTVPALPSEFDLLTPAVSPADPSRIYYDRLKGFSSGVAKAKQTIFRTAALIIIGTHVTATLVAVFALRLHGGVLPWLLLAEIALLAGGFATHRYLHRARAAGTWAMARLAAEIGRSGIALHGVPGYLSHLFSLPLPRTLRPLLRTLNTLHLRDVRNLADAWQQRRDSYVAARIDNQIDFYRRALDRAVSRHGLARRTFLIGSLAAIGAAALKLTSVAGWLLVGEATKDLLTGVLGTAAVVLPVVAVAGMSLAASFDLDARVHTYAEMLDFLERQRGHVVQAQSERAFASLALEIEARLLGETANWYSRRAFTGVT